MLGTPVEDAQLASPAGAGHLDQNLVASLGDVDGYENDGDLTGILDRAELEATAWPLPREGGRPDRGS